MSVSVCVSVSVSVSVSVYAWMFVNRQQQQQKQPPNTHTYTHTRTAASAGEGQDVCVLLWRDLVVVHEVPQVVALLDPRHVVPAVGRRAPVRQDGAQLIVPAVVAANICSSSSSSACVCVCVWCVSRVRARLCLVCVTCVCAHVRVCLNEASQQSMKEKNKNKKQKQVIRSHPLPFSSQKKEEKSVSAGGRCQHHERREQLRHQCRKLWTLESQQTREKRGMKQRAI